MSDYPNVKCSRHAPEPGYVVCLHVLEQGAPVRVYEAPTKKEVGQILCGAAEDHELTNMVPICAQCARDRRLVPDPAQN